jgi:hypothetical protein
MVIIIIVVFPILSYAQEDRWQWWNKIHGWEPGMPSWKRWIVISPGYLGPNALPVPEMKKGYIQTESEFSISGSRHFHREDPTQDISAKLFLSFAEAKIAFELYGVVLENYSFTERIRDERFARDKDGRGITQGDLYFSTLIQVFRDKLFPNTLLRIAGRTASGGAYHAARYSDSPGYFFDFSFSKDIPVFHNGFFRPLASAGFYSWQTNNENNLQNDALMYGAGAELEYGPWLITGSISGYSGYLENRDRPQVISFIARHDWERSSASLKIVTGLRHWEYSSVVFTYGIKFGDIHSNNRYLHQ